MKYIYTFEEADWRNKKLLGGKGSSLAQMTQLGLLRRSSTGLHRHW